ncbi:MAG: hypothetical protein QOI53_3311 [Verrucomicrobiota bacterium]|nr:hypothetical protein [Verrucomicrobiota bacterium]
MTLPVASFTDWTPRTFRIASREMCLVPAAACFFAQRYKGGEYLLPRSLAMGNRAGLLLATHTRVHICNNVFNSRLNLEGRGNSAFVVHVRQKVMLIKGA